MGCCETWKSDEREVAAWASVWVGHQFRRNPAGRDAWDSSRNSDVDLVHPKLEVKKPDGEVVVKGITVEVTRRSSGLKTVYNHLEKVKKAAGASLPYLILNERWLICYRDSFPHLYETLIQDHFLPSGAANHMWLLRAFVHKVTVGREFQILKEKTAQSRRYATSKQLFPITVIRAKRKPQLVVVDLSDIENLGKNE